MSDSDTNDQDLPLDSTMASKKPLTIEDLGWTEEQAAEIRGLMSAFTADWDDPSMDVFDEY